jgi:hypothetical protein
LEVVLFYAGFLGSVGVLMGVRRKNQILTGKKGKSVKGSSKTAGDTKYGLLIARGGGYQIRGGGDDRSPSRESKKPK